MSLKIKGLTTRFQLSSQVLQVQSSSVRSEYCFDVCECKGVSGRCDILSREAVKDDSLDEEGNAVKSS